MPLEQRKIILTRDETEQALLSFRRSREAFLPEGQIRDFRVAALAAEQGPEADGDAAAELVVALTPPDDPGAAPERVSLSGPNLTGMLIKFCLENNIPVPKNSQRRSCVHEGLLTLFIQYNLELER